MIQMKLNSPITDEQWGIITDAELESSDEIEFTTPSGKKVMYAKVRHGRWVIEDKHTDYRTERCSMCGWVANRSYIQDKWFYCPHCGAKMDLKEEGK